MLVYRLVKIRTDHHADILYLHKRAIDILEQLCLARIIAAYKYNFEHMI